MNHTVIYDGRCNLCTSLIQLLERLDQGQRFRYVPMQDQNALEQLNITQDDCEMGMILVNNAQPSQRWQGSEAAEEIARLLPTGQVFVNAYRAIPGLKWMGDRSYEQVRDNRYAWFGGRSQTYESLYPKDTDECQTCRL